MRIGLGWAVGLPISAVFRPRDLVGLAVLAAVFIAIGPPRLPSPSVLQTSPKPNVLIVTLIGYSVAEVAGALAATLAMCGPSAVLACHVSRLLTRSGHSRRLNRGCLGFAGVV